ncbi:MULTISPECIES: CdaR family protein [Rossellomorea]|uniref:CdaR family protein n=1 Tax=Rossellomorea TaxID=2837508 RepID=UPI001CCECBD7|nr:MULTISPECIES: CdaR family protein [Rossellomorea]MCA0151143.1 YbbR-like domain-containing protein [Rossellomorea vietnamensis]WGG45846.1 CdaR family protein [Rossellomorea sp. DA94]
MDKFMESRWFMRIVGLMLAFILYLSVNFDDIQKTANNSNGTSQNAIETIQDVPLEVFYDSENLEVSGLPDTVNVTVEGSKAIVQQAKTLKDFQVYVDLNDIGIGEHRVEIQIQNISDKLDVKIDPDFANISVQEKVTEEFTIEPKFNESILSNGYEAEGLAVDPKSVKVTGSKDEVERIAYVIATLDVDEEINENVTREARVQVLDREYNKLDVQVDPEVVDVTVSVVNPSKAVPVTIKQKGSLPKGTTLESISVEPKEATVFGRQDVLDTVEELLAEVDLSKITKDSTITVPLALQDGLNKVAPEEVKVTVNVNTTEEKSLSGIEIKPEGLADEYEYTIMEPENGVVDVSLKGENEEVSSVKKEDFSLALDLTGLEPGEHEVEIEAEGPENVEWTLSQKKVKVEIKEKNTSA